MKQTKNPVSVLVVIHDGVGQALVLERADRAGFWQSVTGSVESGERLWETAMREVAEETGIHLLPEQLSDWCTSVEYEIYPHWRHRYADGITHNREHWFGACVDARVPIVLSEHTAWQWLPVSLAAQKVFSPSNREALLRLAKMRP